MCKDRSIITENHAKLNLTSTVAPIIISTMDTPEIRKDTQNLEVKSNIPKASAPTVRARMAGVYPDADPRKFNTRTTEQEMTDYAQSDHTQKINSLNSVDQIHIHAPRFETPSKEPEYPPEKWSLFIISLLLTVISVFFFQTEVIMLILAFVASLVDVPNAKIFPKQYKILGFNPFKFLFFLDVFLMIVGVLLLALRLIQLLF